MAIPCTGSVLQFVPETTGRYELKVEVREKGTASVETYTYPVVGWGIVVDGSHEDCQDDMSTLPQGKHECFYGTDVEPMFIHDGHLDTIKDLREQLYDYTVLSELLYQKG